jgi:hypothetical protein
MRCPTCLGSAVYNGNPYRPFCSERCKLIDLGRWASEAFRIPITVPDGREQDGGPDTEERDAEETGGPGIDPGYPTPGNPPDYCDNE